MHFSTTLAMALAALPLSFASSAVDQQVRTVANFWREPGKSGYIGWINENNLDRCITVVGSDSTIGSAEVLQYPERAFWCNLYEDTRCTGDWVTQITGYRDDLPGEDIYVRSARCYSYNIDDDGDDGDDSD